MGGKRCLAFEHELNRQGKRALGYTAGRRYDDLVYKDKSSTNITIRKLRSSVEAACIFEWKLCYGSEIDFQFVSNLVHCLGSGVVCCEGLRFNLMSSR